MDIAKLTYEQIGAWADVISRSGGNTKTPRLLQHWLKGAAGRRWDARMLCPEDDNARRNQTGMPGTLWTYRQALEREPENPLALRDIAVALSLMGRMGEALEYFDRALTARSGFGKGPGAMPDFFRSCHKLERNESDWAARSPATARFQEEPADVEGGRRARKKHCDEDICAKVIEAFKDDRNRILETIAVSEEKFKEFTTRRRSIPPEAFSFFSVLRKWNSYTPILPSEKGDNQGGGYFLYIRGTAGRPGRGIVIDPGFNFLKNFYEEGFKATDIDAVLIGHAHNDHTVDLEAILALIHKINAGVCKRSGKKIDVFLNLGTFQKYSGWLNIQNSGDVDEVKVLHAGNTYDLSKKYNGLKIHAVKAEHDEVIADKYSLGFILEFDGCSIALTGDTGWKTDNSVAAPYKRHDVGLMVAHLGSIKQAEFDYAERKTPKEKQKCFYPQHLGILGVGAMLDSVRPKLAVISEFGEELKPLRKEVAEKFDEVLDGTRCIPGEVGLHVRIPDLAVYCIVHRDFVPYREIRIFGRPDQSDLFYHKDAADDRDKAEIHDLARELAQKERAMSIFERLKRGPVKIR